MAGSEKARDLLLLAQKKLNSWFGSNKYEEAAEIYTKAANLFKIDKKLEEAADAFNKAADCYIKSDSGFYAASSYVNAANCLKKINLNEAVRNMSAAVNIYKEDGKFSMAAKYEKEIAELCEPEDVEKAIVHYQLAADYYEGENASTSANSCLLKVAQYSAQLEKYDKAIEIFEQVAKNSLDSAALKWNVREYYFKAGLCHLCYGLIHGDAESAKMALEKYQELDPSFSIQRECKLLKELLEAVSNRDPDAFTNAVAEFDSISKLDAWKTTILLRIKESIKQPDWT